MPTTAPATSSAREMIGSRKNHPTLFIEIEVCRTRAFRHLGLDAGEHLRGVFQSPGLGRERNQTTPAQAGRRKLASGQKAQNMRGHAGFLTPAGALVEAAFGHATLIRRTAEGTPSVGGTRRGQPVQTVVSHHGVREF